MQTSRRKIEAFLAGLEDLSRETGVIISLKYHTAALEAHHA